MVLSDYHIHIAWCLLYITLQNSCLSMKLVRNMTILSVREFERVQTYVNIYLPVGRPAGRHRAAVSDADELYGAARCSPDVSGDAGPHGPRPEYSARLQSSQLLQSETLSYQDSTAAEERQAKPYHPDSPAERDVISKINLI